MNRTSPAVDLAKNACQIALAGDIAQPARGRQAGTTQPPAAGARGT